MMDGGSISYISEITSGRDAYADDDDVNNDNDADDDKDDDNAKSQRKPIVAKVIPVLT